jgi:protein HIRA/HIR1
LTDSKAFNPRLFFLPNGEKTRATASTVLALGSNDFSISIWRNILHKPIVVLKEVFGRNLMDLCWSQDGLHLYGCSEDGTICAVEFDPEEFPDRDEMETTDKIIQEFQYTSKRRPRHVPRQLPVVETSFGATTAQATSKVNTIQPRKNRNGDNRRLVTRTAEGRAQNNTNQSTALNSRDAFAAAPEQNSNSSGQTRADMLRDAPSRSDFGNGVNQLEARGSKRKAITLGDNSSGRNMASSRPIISPEVKELRAPRVPASGGSGPSSGKMLGTPQIQSVLRAKSSEGTDEYYLEAENAGTPAGSNKVTFIEDGADIWLDYLPTAILAMAISESFCAVACEDGNLLVYSHAGRQ